MKKHEFFPNGEHKIPNNLRTALNLYFVDICFLDIH